MNLMADTITEVGLADLVGVTTRTIYDFKKRGIMVATGKDFARRQRAPQLLQAPCAISPPGAVETP